MRQKLEQQRDLLHLQINLTNYNLTYMLTYYYVKTHKFQLRETLQPALLKLLLNSLTIITRKEISFGLK